MSVCLTSFTSPSLLHPSPAMSRALSCTPMTRGARHLLAPCPSQPPPLLLTLSPLLPVHAGHAISEVSWDVEVTHTDGPPLLPIFPVAPSTVTTPCPSCSQPKGKRRKKYVVFTDMWDSFFFLARYQQHVGDDNLQ